MNSCAIYKAQEMLTKNVTKHNAVQIEKFIYTKYILC